MRKSLTHLMCQGLFAFLLSVTVGACQAEADVAPDVIRYDVAALVGYFPAIGEPTSAAWVQWSDVEGRNVTMQSLNVTSLDAVVKLTPATTDELIAAYLPTYSRQTPGVREILRRELPEGPYLTGEGLNRAFSTPRSSSRAYLDRVQHTLVLQSRSMRG